MIYGTPTYNIDDDITDKIGIRTLAVSLMWQPSRWPMSLVELDEESPEPPPYSGGIMLVGKQTRRAGGALRTVWTFQGINGDGKSVTFKTRDNTNDFSFSPGFAQVDLKLHPRYEELLKTYQGYPGPDGEIIWPPTLSSGAEGSGLASGSDNSSKIRNPVFGIRDFFRLEGTYSVRYAAFSLAGIQGGVQQIHKTGLPGLAPTYPHRDWLKAPVEYQRRGPVFELTETYWLSGPGGWPVPIYGTASAS